MGVARVGGRGVVADVAAKPRFGIAGSADLGCLEVVGEGDGRPLVGDAEEALFWLAVGKWTTVSIWPAGHVPCMPSESEAKPRPYRPTWP